MYKLLLDSSNTSLSVGIMKDDSLFDWTSYEAWQVQSEKMIPEIDKLLKKNNISKENIDGIITSIGPGSYTGVRIALTIAKVASLALNIPIYTISSLCVLKDNNKPSICLINARSGRSYFAVYHDKETIISDTIKKNDEVLEYIKEHPDYSICGDAKYLGFEKYDSNILKQMVSLFSCMEKCEEPLSLKPVYMKD